MSIQHDDLLYKQIIEELEILNITYQYSYYTYDEDYHCLSNLIIKRLLNLVTKKLYDYCKDAETKRIYDNYHKEYCELLEKNKKTIKSTNSFFKKYIKDIYDS